MPSLQLTTGCERACPDTFKLRHYGNFHRDLDADARHTLLYDRIVPLGSGVDTL